MIDFIILLFFVVVYDITKRTVSRLRTCSRTVLLAGLDAASLPGSDETGCSLRDMTVHVI